MTPHQFRPGDTAYALADGLDTTKGRGYRVHYTGSNGRLLWLHGGVNVRRWHESRDFSPTPPAKETAMETTPKAGDEMKVVVASAPDTNGFVNVLGVHNLIPLSALRPLPDPALTAAQLAVVEAADKWWGGNENHIKAAGAYDDLTDALTALRALSTPPDPMKIAVEALEKLAALDSPPTWIGVRQTAQAALAAIAAVVGEKK